MQTYVAEVGGRAVIAFRAADDDHAQTWIVDEEKIRSELLAMRTRGSPLWDRGATISIRPANMEEDDAWKSRSAWLSGEDGFNSERLVVFLVPVDE
jgi:hypothetical protein